MPFAMLHGRVAPQGFATLARLPLQTNAPLTVMFVHVADTTQLYAKVGDESARTHIDSALGACREISQKSSGRLIKGMGTGLLLTFSDVDGAAASAAEMHRFVDRNGARFSRLVALKVGICHGAVVLENDDVFGDTVNVAARMADLAVPQQTLVPAATRDLLKQPQRGLARGLGRFAIKGKGEPLEVAELIWRNVDDMTQMTRVFAAPRVMTGQLVVRYHHHEWTLTPLAPRLTIGRSADCDVIVSDPQASRLHAKLELRHDKFVLIDQSTNGTLVKVGTTPEMQLHREEVILQGEGTIRFGHPDQSEAQESVTFRCTC